MSKQSLIKTIGQSLLLWLQRLCLLALIAVVCAVAIFSYYASDLPDYHKLEHYNPPLISRVYSREGRLMKEYAKEKRIYIEYKQIPPLVIAAFLSAEDKHYFQHQGLDYLGIVRAFIHNLYNISSGGLAGGSTITQQVVKNFLLSNERTISRKIKEAILAYRINKIYSKERILELYLNQIFLGNNSYGVVCAALNYFNKDIQDLTIAEAATLAAMPQAPSRINPLRNAHRTKQRRDWVIGRMLENGYIDLQQANGAIQAPISITSRFDVEFTRHADYYNEAVRLELVERYGEEELYSQGYTIVSNMDERMQGIATRSLQAGLLSYDRQHGYRGPLGKLLDLHSWQKELAEKAASLENGGYQIAAVLSVSDNMVKIGLSDGKLGKIDLANLKWARKNRPQQLLGPAINKCSEVLQVGDVILAEPLNVGGYALAQIPDVEGGMVVMEVASGKILAMVGGYNFRKSNFNRVVQASRQPGSTFKPIVYLAALEHGYRPDSIVIDEPISVSQGPGLPMWTPRNYGGKHYGEVTVREALARSLNFPVIRVALDIGVKNIAAVAQRLDVFDQPPQTYSVALGAYETNLLKISTAYATIANSGRSITPRLINYVTDYQGQVLAPPHDIAISGPDQEPIDLRSRKQLIDPQLSYDMTSMLQDVVQMGSGIRAKKLHRPIAGKTGTSGTANDTFDCWFIGYTPDILVGVFVGFDQPRTLGKKANGSNLALPIFINFMEQALAGTTVRPFEKPIDYGPNKEAGLAAGNPATNSSQELEELEDDSPLSGQEEVISTPPAATKSSIWDKLKS